MAGGSGQRSPASQGKEVKVKLVHSGVVRIAELQQQGYAYLKVE